MLSKANHLPLSLPGAHPCHLVYGNGGKRKSRQAVAFAFLSVIPVRESASPTTRAHWAMSANSNPHPAANPLQST
jgi:hypothetical protein